MIAAACHCGAVRLEVATPPVTITDCNCSICAKLGALWAYYRPDEVEISADDGALESYVRDPPKDTPGWESSLAFVRCKTCGCTTHWRPLDPAHPRMGVNTRMMAPEVRTAARVRFLDGAVTWRYLDEADLAAPSAEAPPPKE